MEKTRRRAFLFLLVMTLGWLLSRPHHAYGESISLKQPEPASRFERPEDLLELIPFLGELPRTFLFGDGFAMKVSGSSLRIDHMGTRSRSSAAKRNCMVGLSYTTPVAGFFTSRVDVPLLFAPEFKADQWAMNTPGDYVAYFSKGATDHASARLVFSAKF